MPNLVEKRPVEREPEVFAALTPQVNEDGVVQVVELYLVVGGLEYTAMTFHRNGRIFVWDDNLKAAGFNPPTCAPAPSERLYEAAKKLARCCRLNGHCPNATEQVEAALAEQSEPPDAARWAKRVREYARMCPPDGTLRIGLSALAAEMEQRHDAG